MRITIPALMFAAAMLGACASMTPEQTAETCLGTDWHRFGINDGRLGVDADSRMPEFADCADAGAPVDVLAYQSGREIGLRNYCTAESGYRVGFEGRRYRKVCPPELEPDFLQGYRLGRKDRPAIALRPSIGIGIGSGGVSGGIGLGIGLFGSNHTGRHCHNPYIHRCRW